MMRYLTPLLVLLAIAPPARAANDDFGALADKIRQVEEREPGIPMDPSLYAEQVTYGHNIGPARTQSAAALLAGIGPEQNSFKRFVADRQSKLIRLVASGDSVVAETEMSGTLPDQTQFDTKTAIFFTVASGKIVRMELWGDPILGPKFADYMAKDPEVIAARQKK